MAGIKAKELKMKPKSELELMLKENREKMREMKFDLASKKLKNVHQLRGAKKEIARILTILKQGK